MRRLKERGADEQGLKPFVGPGLNRITINALLDALEAEFCRQELKSLKKALSHLRNVRAALGHRRAVDVGVGTINRYIDSERKEGKANGTINRRLGYLGEALGMAVRGDFGDDLRLSSMPKIRKLHEADTGQGFFSKAEFFAVLSHIGDHDRADYLDWFFWTGMRPEEIASLTWRPFDRETWMLRLPGKDAKTGKARALALVGRYREIIERKMRARRFGCDLIFHRDGEKAGRFDKRWKRACLEAGVSGKIPYDLRRTAVRNMKRAGNSEGECMAISGHRTRAMFDRYNIIDEDDIAQTAARTAVYVENLPDDRNVVSIDQPAASEAIP